MNGTDLVALFPSLEAEHFFQTAIVFHSKTQPLAVHAKLPVRQQLHQRVELIQLAVRLAIRRERHHLARVVFAEAEILREFLPQKTERRRVRDLLKQPQLVTFAEAK